VENAFQTQGQRLRIRRKLESSLNEPVRTEDERIVRSVFMVKRIDNVPILGLDAQFVYLWNEI
jgi:hypothetical protein